MNIYLIGYRGTGKTSLAPAVAARLGGKWSAVDLDALLEESAGRSIAEIFATDGEAAFRELEHEILARTAMRDSLVVATGGGVILRPDNRTLLRQGLVVWLTASVDTIAARLLGDASTVSRRPSLTGRDSIAEIRQVLAQREPVYRELAGLVLSTDTAALEELAGAVEQFVRGLRA